MKKMIVGIVLVSLFGIVNGATKSELRDVLVASGNYLDVSEPTTIRRSAAPEDRLGKKYAIVLLTQSPTDTLVALTSSVYIWVLDDGEPTEQAFFIRRNPVDVPSPAPSFRSVVLSYMVSNTIDGHILETGVIGNVEWALVVRYIPGADAQHIVAETVRVTRTDETTWAMKIVE
jgi:hypothetical protein